MNWVNISIPRGAQPLLPKVAGYSAELLLPGSTARAFDKALEDDHKHTELKLRRARGSSSLRRSMLQQRQRQLLQRPRRNKAPGIAQPPRHLLDLGGSGGGQRQVAGAAAAPANGGKGDGAAARAMERVAYAPDWMFGSWVARGTLGLWDPTLTPQPKQVGGGLGRKPLHPLLLLLGPPAAACPHRCTWRTHTWRGGGRSSMGP
jgi:hypothetical protein